MGGQRLLDRFKNRLKGREESEVKEEQNTPSPPVGDPQPPKVTDTVVDPQLSPGDKQQPTADDQPPAVDQEPPIVNKKPFPVDGPSETNSERNKLQQQLWNQAYDDLQDSGNKYMAQYEGILISELKEDNPDDDSVSLGSSHEERWRQMQRLVEIGLSKTEKEARGYEIANYGLELFGTVRALVEPAVSAVPQAAIPWVGVCFILEVISNPVKQPGVHCAGLQHVLSRVNWYWNLAELLLGDNFESDEYGRHVHRHSRACAFGGV